MPRSPADSRALVEGPVLLIGSGLIGASVGLALRRQGVEVYIRDADATAAQVAASRGAGLDREPDRPPRLVVVATPPEQLGPELAKALCDFPDAVVTDVGSVKCRPLEHLDGSGADLSRYVGSHPMAGSERSGPLAADGSLFEGRAWAVVERPGCSPDAVTVVEALATACGANVVRLSTDDHDLAVAQVSHLPHVLAALVAGHLPEAPPEHLSLSGQGLRDVTRIAAGDPVLWRQIVTANADALARLLGQIRDDLDALVEALSSGDEALVQRLLEAGVEGTASIPAKHGGPSLDLVAVTVAIPDRPGALAHLFADAEAAGVNIEDLRMDHDPARAYGLIELDVAEAAADRLVAALLARDWVAHR